jgi:chromosome segregation ATPase
VITEIAHFLAREESAWGFSLLILLLFLGVLTWFEISWRRLRREIRSAVRFVRAAKDVSDFRTGFHSISERLAANAAVRHAWIEYSDHLLVGGSDPSVTIRNTIPPSHHFTVESLSAGRVPLRFFGGFPNMLVGFGIFGTFLGLAAGIHLVAPTLQGNADALKGALAGLLGGAFLSFLKSAVAILCSIFFTLFERHGVGALEGSVDEFCTALDRRLELQTPEQIARDQLSELVQQSKALRQYNEELAPTISARIEASLERVHQGLIELKAERATSDQQFLTSSLDEFRKTLHGAAGSELESLAATLGAVRDTVDRSASALAVGNEQFESANLRVAAAMEQTLQSATTGLSRHFEVMGEGMRATLAESTRELADQLEAGGRALASQVAEQSQHLAAGAEHMQRTLDGFQSLLSNAASAIDKMREVAESLTVVNNQFGNSMDALRSIEKSITSVSERLDGSAHQQGQHSEALAEASRTIADAMQRTAAAWADYQARFDGLDGALGTVFKELDSGLTRYSEKIRDYVRDIEGHMARAAENLAGTVGQLSDDLSELPSEVRELGQHVKALRGVARIES